MLTRTSSNPPTHTNTNSEREREWDRQKKIRTGLGYHQHPEPVAHGFTAGPELDWLPCIDHCSLLCVARFPRPWQPGKAASWGHWTRLSVGLAQLTVEPTRVCACVYGGGGGGLMVIHAAGAYWPCVTEGGLWWGAVLSKCVSRLRRFRLHDY